MVEWKKLGEVCKVITSPLKIKSSNYKDIGRIPIIDQGESFIAGYTDVDKYIPAGKYVLFGDHSEWIKYVDFAFVQGADGLKILVANNGIVPKYMYYTFLNFYKKEQNYKRHWSTAKETLIPIPPISEQIRVVAILDKFTELERELERERALRVKQYEWYRDRLLDFKGGR